VAEKFVQEFNMAIKSSTKTTKTGLKTITLTLTGVSLVSIMAYLVTLGFVITAPDDVCAGTITDPCNVTISFKNPTMNSIVIKSKEQLVFDFSPTSCVKDFKLYKDGKEIDWAKGVTFTRYKTTNMQLVLYKTNPSCDIKWGLNSSGYYLDPIFYGVPVENLTLTDVWVNKTIYWNETIDNPYWVNESYQETEWYDSWSCISNDTGCLNDTCYCNQTFYCGLGETCLDTLYSVIVTKWHMVEYHNYSVIVYNTSVHDYLDYQLIGVNDVTFKPIINIGFANDTLYCSLPENILCCDSSYDANNDGICKSGESYFEIVDEPDQIVVIANDKYQKPYETFLKNQGLIIE